MANIPTPSVVQIPMTQFGNASLYVGDLDAGVAEAEIFELFNRVAPVVSVRVCRDQIRKVSLGYAYVNFHNPQDATRAMEVLNFTSIHGKPIRIMFSQRDPSIRKSGCANLFIKYLHPTIDNKSLHEIFVAFGTVLSCKVATDINGQSKGYGFVQFENEEAAQRAIDRLNGMLMNGKKVYVGLFLRHKEREHASGSQKFTNVYIKNLPEVYTNEDLIREFERFGSITSAVVMRDANGNSRGFAFVNFENSDAAVAAVANINGKILDDKVLYVGRAQKKAEREAELKVKYEQERSGRLEKLQGRNLYLKNLDESIDDAHLRDLFSEFGNIISCKVVVDSQGQSKGSGFVAFSSSEEANRAITEMYGKVVGRKPLYVALAQSREERRARLQAHFAHINALGNLPPVMPSMPVYHPGQNRLAPQQLYFGQGATGLIPPQASGYGFQQQLIDGTQPALAPNLLMSYNFPRQGQPGQRMAFRRGQQQLIQRNASHSFRYRQNPSSEIDPVMLPQGLIGPMKPFPLDGGTMHIPQTNANRSLPIPITALASTLASATPDQQRVMLGGQLYPLVENIEQEHTGKLTGMLLEMDQTEVLHLIESQDALQSKVAEAMEVLRLAQAVDSDAADRLGSLSLSD
ncbi:polyadenylate-binding protein 3-like [Typha latifolia]|uniref:polyadenylate-binding protein 3-like n=1 Tax=Typha latifolia TaxID=4733 RepID=UPI003C2D6092